MDTKGQEGGLAGCGGSAPPAAMRLWISGVAFELRGVGLPPDDRFGPFFEPFLEPGTVGADTSCRAVIGLDATGRARPGHPANSRWSFHAEGPRVKLTRWHASGDAVWHAESENRLEDVCVELNPAHVAECCGTIEQAWPRRLGLPVLIFRLLQLDGLVFHGCGADLAGHGILCAGESGRGKSTIARLLDARGAQVLSDERPAVRQVASDQFRLYGTPWPSSAGFARNAAVPLRRIYFLEHGPHDELVPLAAGGALRRLIRVAGIPWQDPAFFDPLLKVVDALLRTIPCAILRFRPTPAVVDLLCRDLAAPRSATPAAETLPIQP